MRGKKKIRRNVVRSISGVVNRRKRKYSYKAKRAKRVTKRVKKKPKKKKKSKKKSKKTISSLSKGVKDKRKPFFEDTACRKHLPPLFGPCSTRKRKIVLADLGMISQTLTSDGKARGRSKFVRHLEYDYVCNDVLSFKPALNACIRMLCAILPELTAQLTPKNISKLAAIVVSVEVDGIQHRGVVDFLPGKKENKENRFLAQRENDRIKDKHSIFHNWIQRRVDNYMITTETPKGRTCTLSEFLQKLRCTVCQLWKDIMKRILVGLFLDKSIPLPGHARLCDMLVSIDLADGAICAIKF
jgi:hypothetical protein